jgi:hypothetical protein
LYIEYYKDAIFGEHVKDKNTHILLSLGLTFGLYPIYERVNISKYDLSKTLVLNSTVFSNNFYVEYRLNDMLAGMMSTIPKKKGINNKLIGIMDTISLKKIQFNKDYKEVPQKPIKGTMQIIETIDNGLSYYLLSSASGNVLHTNYQNIKQGPHQRLYGYNKEIIELFNIPSNKIKYVAKPAETINFGAFIESVKHIQEDDKIFVELYNYLYKNSKRTLLKYNTVSTILPKVLGLIKNKSKVNKDIVVEFNYSDIN